MGFTPSFVAASTEERMTAAAPSFRLEALAGVMVPSARYLNWKGLSFSFGLLDSFELMKRMFVTKIESQKTNWIIWIDFSSKSLTFRKEEKQLTFLESWLEIFDLVKLDFCEFLIDFDHVDTLL